MKLALLAVLVVVLATVAVLGLRDGARSSEALALAGGVDDATAPTSPDPVDLVARPEPLEAPPSEDERRDAAADDETPVVDAAAREAAHRDRAIESLGKIIENQNNAKLTADALLYLTHAQNFQTLNDMKRIQLGRLDASGRLVLLSEGDDAPENGLHSAHYDNGNPAQQGHYRNGKRVGIWTEWYSNGKKKTEGSYVYGAEHGLWTSWHPDGKRSAEGEYLYGKREGSWIQWWEHGPKKEVGSWMNGKREGRFLEYYADERKQSDGTWRDGVKEERWRTWHGNGTLWSEGHYELGKRVGRWKYWHADSRIDETQTGYYENDVKVKD